ncbi:MAG: nodulation protein NfeD [Bacteroidales bacterium]|jgi:membrane-bound serine protease (ClpP class)|nr:nodulation protein NfeD [Bacteroidales bacterium]
MNRFLVFHFLMLWLLLTGSVYADTVKVYHFTIEETISKPAVRKTEKAIEMARANHANIILLTLNTFGGELESAEKIRTSLLESDLPVYVFVNPNAASAGALIAIACDSIYMAPGASIGAASVVNPQGDILPDKYQSYMRSMMRSTAEERGRDPRVAEAMVDPDTYVAGISDSGKVLTFTTREAIAQGYCEGEAVSEQQVLTLAGISSYLIEEQSLSWIDRLISFLINPAVSGILIMLIVGGIYFEMQTPGIGLPLGVAICAALFYFMPHYLEGLATHWEILLFLVGIGLLLLEVFVIPGFGIAGISGIVLVVFSLVLAMIFNIGFDFRFVSSRAVTLNFLVVCTSLITGFLVALWVGKRLLLARSMQGTLALHTRLEASKGFTAHDEHLAHYVGQTATVQTFMRPSGKICIHDEILDALSVSGSIDKGDPVKIIGFENAQMLVEKI